MAAILVRNGALVHGDYPGWGVVVEAGISYLFKNFASPEHEGWDCDAAGVRAASVEDIPSDEYDDWLCPATTSAAGSIGGDSCTVSRGGYGTSEACGAECPFFGYERLFLHCTAGTYAKVAQGLPRVYNCSRVCDPYGSQSRNVITAGSTQPSAEILLATCDFEPCCDAPLAASGTLAAHCAGAAARHATLGGYYDSFDYDGYCDFASFGASARVHVFGGCAGDSLRATGSLTVCGEAFSVDHVWAGGKTISQYEPAIDGIDLISGAIPDSSKYGGGTMTFSLSFAKA